MPELSIQPLCCCISLQSGNLVSGNGAINPPLTRLEQLPSSPVFHTSPAHSPVAASPRFAVNSPTAGSASGPTLPDAQHLNQRRVSPPFFSSSKRSASPMPPSSTDTHSTNSLSTTASTSSRTLKTPQSKLDQIQSPAIASGSGSLDGHSSPTAVMAAVRRGKEIAEPRSPTPIQARLQPAGRKSSEKAFRERLPPPPITQGPLPSIPAGRPASNAEVRPFNGSPRPRHPPPAPLDIRRDNRLSQDWIAVNIPEQPITEQTPAKSSSPLLPEASFSQRHPARLPPSVMVPMKQTVSRRPPSFDRANTALPISPNEREQRQGRASLDRIRNVIPTPLSKEKISVSTPPAAMPDAATLSMGSQRTVFGHEPVRPVPSRIRLSEDAIRPSIDAMRDGSTKKQLKAGQREQQRALGVNSSIGASDRVVEAERQPSGLSLKKSTGALKALFNRGASGKPKDRSDPPPMPSAEEQKRVRSRPSTAPSPNEGRPRPSFGRPRTPGPPIPTATSGDRVLSSIGPGRSSLSADRAMPIAPPLLRGVSEGSHPAMSLPSRPRLPMPLRDLPSLPPPSPVPPPVSRPAQSTLAEALPASSLPYLSPMRASFLLQQNEPNLIWTPAGSASSESSSTTTRQSTYVPQEISPIKPSRSLHLLQLPDLDLDLDVTFDRIGMSPSTPRKPSPRRSPQGRLSPKSPTPQRPAANTASPVQEPARLSRTGSERRRSKSFDGPGSGADMWQVDASQLFASSTSSFAPMLSKPREQIVVPDRQTSATLSNAKPVQHHVHTESFSSQPSAPSSSDHARTPSNASSMNETPSPSPPRTPGDEERSLEGLDFADLDLSSTSTTPTPSAPETTEQDGLVGKPFFLNEPPSIPLLALPGAAKSPALAPSAVIEPPRPAEPEKVVIKGPRAGKRVLLSRSKVITAESGVSCKALARELELLLYS